MDHTLLYRPEWKQEWRILRTQATDYKTYYAFPALTRCGNNVLVTVKSGQKHWGDEQSSLTQGTLNAPKQQVQDVRVIYEKAGFTPQMGEIVSMPNGDVCVYIDMQQCKTNHRTGLWELRSHDGGKTYPVSRPVGVINGIEYGYAMDLIAKGNQVWMLVMTFPYQTGGRDREVHLITSRDSGETWEFCANLKELFGFSFNECALLGCDEGFLIFTRGETDRCDRQSSADDFASGQHLVVLDENYRVLRSRDYRATTDFFTLTGRPRLYWIKGELCLFTRQWNEDSHNRMMSCDLFRIDPCTLEIFSRVRLDEPRFPRQDGHYPVVYTQDGLLHVITYITCDRDQRETFEQKCDLVQLSYRLDEVLGYGKENA